MSSITINGTKIVGESIQVKDGRIIVDGVDVTDQHNMGGLLKFQENPVAIKGITTKQNNNNGRK